MNEIISFCSGILASVLANVLGGAEEEVKSSLKKRKLEKNIVGDLNAKIKEQFEQESVKEWILSKGDEIRQEGYIFSEEDKQEFLKDFFLQYPSLNYIHSQNVESVILNCIDEVNDWADGILSDENKILLGTLKREGQKNTKEVLEQISDGKKEILDSIRELKDRQEETGREEDEKKRAEFFDQIENLYRIQNYLVRNKKDYFVAEQKSGIIRANALIIPMYSETEELSLEDIGKILEIINREDKSDVYQYIHIVTNGSIGKSDEKYFMPYEGKIRVFRENEIINEIMDFTAYLNNNITQYKKSNLYGHYIDVLDLKTSEPLEYSVRDFLQETQYNAFLILGDYGCGKTSFLLNLAYQLSEEYFEGESEYIPIFVPLRDYAKAINMENLFLDIFVNKCHMPNVSIDAFKLMLKYMKFVLLFDGFDEVAKRVNYDVKFEIFNQICRYCSETTKIIVTCRPNYFQENREYRKLIQSAHLQFEPNEVNHALFDETYIADLTAGQIHEYILSYRDVLQKEGLDTNEIEYLIAHTHDLTDLSRRPFLLNIIVRTLPKLISDSNGQEKKEIEINAASLYRNYTELWLDRENSKGKTLIRKEDKLHFCMHIAYKMYRDDILSIHFSQMPDEIREYFPNLHQMDEIDYFSHDIQSCSFMNTDGDGNFKFIHKSFMEYFVACYMMEKLREYKNRETGCISQFLSVRDISTEVALFLNDMLYDDKEMYQHIKTVLESLVGNSNESVSKNAVTLLSKMSHNIAVDIQDGGSYADSDLSYSTVENTEIARVDFTGTTFYGAVIRDVQFIDCIFEETIFQKAELTRVNFSYQSLDGADLSYCKIKDCIFVKSSMTKAKISQSLLEKNNFMECDMSEIEANGTKYRNNINYESAIGIPYEMC